MNFMEMEMTDKVKPVLSVDFDGVLHRYSKGLHDGSIYDSPTPGAQEFIRKAQEHFFVMIFTARARNPEMKAEIIEWLDEHGFPEVPVTSTKYPSFLWLDDRCERFTGAFPDPESLLKFQPWNRHDTEATEPGWKCVSDRILEDLAAEQGTNI